MGNATSSVAKRDSNDINGCGDNSCNSNDYFPPLNWSVVSSDPLSRSEVLLPSSLDLSLYPLDGRPEHGQFTNHLQLKVHYYIWYPPCNISNNNSSNSSSCSCADKNNESVSAVCSHTAKGSPAEFGLPIEQQKQDEQQREFCLDCKRERVRHSRGVVVLLHGYQSHARFSWLRRWKPPFPVQRDPRIYGYKRHDEIESELQAKKTTEEHERRTEDVAENDAKEPSTRTEDTAASEACGSCVGCTGTPQYNGSLVEALNSLGFVVAALDAESHGLSEGWEGRRGGVREAEDLALDALQFIHVVRRRMWVLKEGIEIPAGESESKDPEQTEKIGPDELAEGPKKEENKNILGDTEMPLFLIGSSLGAWAATRCVEKFKDSQAISLALPAAAAAATGDEGITAAAAPCLWVKGLVLLSPMFDVEAAKEGCKWKYTRPIVSHLAAWTPHLHVSKGNVYDTRYTTEADHRQKDRLYIQQGTRARTALEVLTKAPIPLQEKEAEKINEISCNAILLIHNALDEQCGINGAVDFYKKIKLADKTFLAVNAVPPEVSRHPKDEEEEKRKEKYVFYKRVSPELQEELRNCADVSLNGLDVHHSFASETDGNAVLTRVVQWVEQHSS